MATRKQKIKVGIFLVVCFGLIALMLLRVTGMNRNPGNVYWIEFDESVLGLYEGGLVEYLGVPVGKVQSINVVPANKMRGKFEIAPPPSAGDPAHTPANAPADYTITLGSTGTEQYHVIDASSTEVYDAPIGEPNPTIRLVPGKRYTFHVVDAENNPFQIIGMGEHSANDRVLMAQGNTQALLEDDPDIGWREVRDGAQGSFTFTVTRQLLQEMSAGGRTPGYRSSGHVFRAHVELLIGFETDLHEGIEGQIVIYSLAAGTMAISLSGGDAQAPMLPPGSQIPTRKSIVASLSTSINTMTSNLTTITEQFMQGLEGLEPGSIAQMVDRINIVLDETEGLLSEGRIMLGETTNTVSSLREDSKKVIGEVLTLAEDVRLLTGNVNRMVTATTAKIEGFDTAKTEAQLGRALTEMGDLAERLNATVAKFDDLSANMLHEGSNIEYAIRNALGQVAEAFDALRNLVQQVRDDPGSLVRGPSKLKEPVQ